MMLALLLLLIGMWDARLKLSEQAFYGMAYLLS